MAVAAPVPVAEPVTAAAPPAVAVVVAELLAPGTAARGRRLPAVTALVPALLTTRLVPVTVIAALLTTGLTTLIAAGATGTGSATATGAAASAGATPSR